MNKFLQHFMKFIVFLLIVSCSDDDSATIIIDDNQSPIRLPNTPFNYSDITFPNHLNQNVLQGPGQNAAIDNDNTPNNNTTTDDGATLGRVLFYDKNLSANGTVACASCHKQEEGFSDSSILSLGFSGGNTRRHSMSLVNARWYNRGRFFWDERAQTLEQQVLMPFQDEVEMGMTLDEVVAVIEDHSFYDELFVNAFGDEDVTTERISLALAQFVRSIVSVNSKYDEGRAMVNNPIQDFPNFTDSENNGKQIFFRPIPQGGGSCIRCHATEAFINTANGPTNNGLDAVSTDDLGVFEAINNQNLIGAFKVTSLKNVELSAPYMHDGRFATLEEVVEHYNSGIQNHQNLAPILRNPQTGQPIQLNLTEQEKEDLVNFLKTLTDNDITEDLKFSDPFIE